MFNLLLVVSAVASLQAQDVEITDISSTDVLCGGAFDGTLTVSITGGNAPYTYLLLNYLLQPVDKEENTVALSLLNMIKDVQIKNSENDTMAELIKAMEKGDGEGDISKEKMQEYKKFLSFMDKVKDSELPDKK